MSEQIQQPLENAPPIPPSKWAAGQPITARKLNETVVAVQDLISGVRPPVQVVRSPVVEGGGRIGGLFPVTLVKTGGIAGTANSGPTWRYSVRDPGTNEELATNVRPDQSPHQWKRVGDGRMDKATFGYAHYDENNNLVLGWINEVVEQQACSS